MKHAAKSHARSLLQTLGQHGTLLLISALFVLGAGIALVMQIPISNIMGHYSYDVLVILITMELFTNLITETGIMQFLAIKLAELSRGKKRACLIVFGGMMFLISACLNNITAVMMILPVIFVLLKTLEVDKKYVAVFFATILALSNTGGAASPIGDFPAIVIMTSGITNFLAYLTHAFPLFALTSVALIAVWSLSVKPERGKDEMREYALLNLKSQYKHTVIRFDALIWLALVFVGMFLAWSFVPQDIIPPEIIAILGYAIALLVCCLKGIKIKQIMDMQSVLTIAAFLFFAEVISQTGILATLATFLQQNIENPKLLVIAIMLITSLIAGIFSAGPAAAAMMPIIVELCTGPLQAHTDWIAVAYASAICAGSSLFLWSATAGFILSNKINGAGIEEGPSIKINWGAGQYFKYGIFNYLIQIGVAIGCVLIVL